MFFILFFYVYFEMNENLYIKLRGKKNITEKRIN